MVLGAMHIDSPSIYLYQCYDLIIDFNVTFEKLYE